MIGDYVNAYSGELGEELDQQRIVRRRRRHGDPQGHHQGARNDGRRHARGPAGHDRGHRLSQGLRADRAASGPRTRSCSSPGRVDHKGDETVLLADAVWTWEEAQQMGSSEFTRQLGRLDRGRRARPAGAYNGNGNGNGNGYSNGNVTVPIAVEPPGTVRTIPLVSPLRGGDVTGTIEVRIGGATRAAVMDAPVSSADDEPPFPDEVAAVINATAEEATLPVSATPDQSLHVHFARAGQDQVVQSFGALREIIHERPGSTKIVLHVPTADGRMQRMDLRVGVAYDAELLSMIERRVGARSVTLRLQAP